MRNKQLEIKTEKKPPFEVTHISLQIEGLPDAFSGYTIAQLTDFHFGICTPAEIIEQAVQTVNELKPSLILFTGDFVQVSATGLLHVLATKVSPKLFRWKEYRRDVRKLAKQFAKIIEPLKPTDGILGVFGNHDYHEGLGTIKRQFPDEINWLVNDSFEIKKGNDSIVISGIDDHKYGKPSIAETISSIPKTDNNKADAKILMAHNPDVFTCEDANLLNEYDLVVCGHTHGGQICLPGRIPLITRTSQKDHCSGLSKFNETSVYVNRGIGRGGLPIRIFCPPEILLITLCQAQHQTK